MRQQRQIFEFDIKELPGMKTDVMKNIEQLPDDERSYDALEDIKDVLDHIVLYKSDRPASVEKELKSFDNPSIQKYPEISDMLTMYIMHMNLKPKQRAEFLDQWKHDAIVNWKLLITEGSHDIENIFHGYDDKSNPAVKKFVDKVIRKADLGIGKGEFLLCVLCDKILKPNKGDLEVNGELVEVKTSDLGDPRFQDDDISPTPKYTQWVEIMADKYSLPIDKSRGGVDSGMNLKKVMNFGNELDSDTKNNFWEDFRTALGYIFPRQEKNISSILNSLRSGDFEKAKDAYAKTSFDYYKDNKHKQGFLFIDLAKEDVKFTYFKEYEDLEILEKRFEAKTIYPLTFKPRYAYPQIALSDVIAQSKKEAGIKTEKAKKLGPDGLSRGRGRPRKERNDADPGQMPLPLDSEQGRLDLEKETQQANLELDARDKTRDRNNPIFHAFQDRIKQSADKIKASEDMISDIVDLLSQGRSDEEIAQELLNVVYESEMSRLKKLLGRAF